MSEKLPFPTLDTSAVVNIRAVEANHRSCAEWWRTLGRFVCLTHGVSYFRDVDGRWVVGPSWSPASEGRVDA